MNNQRSAKEQLLFNFLLSFVAVYFIFQYFNPQQQNAAVAPRKADSLQKAFQGIDPADGARLTPATASTEIAKLQKNIKENPNDGLAQWSRLRIGLIEQYILQKMEPVTIPGSFFSRSWTGDIYDEAITYHTNDALDAQAIYQKGDMLWRRGKAKGIASREAAWELEKLLQKSRSSSEFNNLKIYVQTPESTDDAPQFVQKTVIQALGGPGNADPNSVLHRVDQYYQTTGLYQSVDKVVQLFGDRHPAYSYGLAILFFAVCTRVIMQPLTKKQYDSMKGMQVIAPEMKKVQEKYKGKTDQASQMAMVKEIQDLQRRHGVSPMLGCGLGLLQVPIFFYIVSPAMKHYEAKMELAGASFLWIANLARPDIVLLVLYGITMFVSFRISSLPPTDETQRQQQRMMMFMMPMFPFFLLTYPSAFALYWMLFNITSTILQYRMMKANDPDKRVITSILGSPAPAFVVEEAQDAVPPRPKDGVKTSAKKAKLKMPEAEAFSEGESLNGTLNGKANSNGKASSNGKSAANGHENGAESGAKIGAGTGKNAGSGASGATASGTSGAASKSSRRKRRY
ncbi:MAG TPA: membrane protein insertase YidC [Abditibacteriaceae bacterium]|jgi:YidC/Oxa1 family membrane protein insertase